MGDIESYGFNRGIVFLPTRLKLSINFNSTASFNYIEILTLFVYYVSFLCLPKTEAAIGIMHSDRRVSLFGKERVKLKEGDFLPVARTVD